MKYQHTQTGWRLRIAFAIGALGLAVMAIVRPLDPPIPRELLIGGAALFAVLGFAWSQLTIEVDGERARWWFGLGLPRGTLALAEIAAVETTRTTFWQGWGVHRTRNGWLYNVAGYDAVLITRRDGRRLMLGSDEPRRLKAAFDRALARPRSRVRA
jgi:hypothetical protein